MAFIPVAPSLGASSWCGEPVTCGRLPKPTAAVGLPRPAGRRVPSPCRVGMAATPAAAHGSSPPSPSSPTDGRPAPGADGVRAATTLTVAADSRTYPIHFGDGLLGDPASYAPYVGGDKCLVVTNTTVGPLYAERVVAALTALGKTVSVLELPDGEEYKDMQRLNTILDRAMELRLDRKSTLLALGGGVVGDITGFAAAVYVRGVPFVQLPTTLLAVVDSAVGGKTAVNHPLGKNMIGAFYQPRAVLVDATVLATLDDRQLAAGIAEVVKYGLIRDLPLLDWLEANMEAMIARDPAALEHAMLASCANKAAVVAADEREGGVRATLNLGHTFGHAIEAAMGYGTWLHGEAVAAGMVMAVEMSRRLGWLPAHPSDPPGEAGTAAVRRVEALLARAGLPVRPPPSMTLETFMTYMSVDKKVESGVLKLVLLRRVGDAVVTADYNKEVLYDTIMYYQQLFLERPGEYENALVHLEGTEVVNP